MWVTLGNEVWGDQEKNVCTEAHIECDLNTIRINCEASKRYGLCEVHTLP